MVRKPHILEITKGQIRPTNLIFIDTETYPEIVSENETFNQLKLGVAQFYRRINNTPLKLQSEIVFKTNSEVIDYINRVTRSKTTTYCIAHNWKFDAMVLNIFELWVEDGWELISWYMSGGVVLISFRKETKKLILLDNMNFYSGKLETLSKIVNLPKLEIDFDTASDEALTIYCRRDVEVMVELWRLWIEFLDVNDIGNFRNTLASTAFSAYRYRFMDYKIFIHDDTEALTLERESYRGGRVHPLFQGSITGDDFYLLDINSMYPYVMSFEQFPISLYGTKENPSIDYLKRKIKKYLIVADVDIRTDENPYGLKDDGRLIFPTGEYRITLTTPELLYALDMGHILKVHKMAWYRGEKIFENYVNFFYSLRKEYKREGNKPFDHICKILLNSLYGKFGQWNYNQKAIKPTDINHIEVVYGLDKPTMTYYTLTALGGKIWQSWKEGESYHSYPAIASHVTAYGRMLLYNYIKQAGSRNCLYCDTDSVLVNSQGYENLKHLIDNDRLGALKIETISKNVTINASKDYQLDDRIKRKGVRPSAKKITETTFEQARFSSVKSMVKQGRVDGVTIKQVQKRLTHQIHGLKPIGNGYLDPVELAYLSLDLD